MNAIKPVPPKSANCVTGSSRVKRGMAEMPKGDHLVGSAIFESGNPAQRPAAVVKGTTFFDDPGFIAKVSRGLGEAIGGHNVEEVPEPHRLAEGGW